MKFSRKRRNKKSEGVIDYPPSEDTGKHGYESDSDSDSDDDEPEKTDVTVSTPSNPIKQDVAKGGRKKSSKKTKKSSKKPSKNHPKNHPKKLRNHLKKLRNHLKKLGGHLKNAILKNVVITVNKRLYNKLINKVFFPF
jgi:hypothetical protein